MRSIVVNTGPIIALVAATGSLDILTALYERVVVPNEVQREILAGGSESLEADALRSAGKALQIDFPSEPVPPGLANQLDSGEASVISTALFCDITLVAIDEKVGRRVARLNGLNVTGSIGILIRGRKEGVIESLGECIQKMRLKGIWISDSLVADSLEAVGEHRY